MSKSFCVIYHTGKEVIANALFYIKQKNHFDYQYGDCQTQNGMLSITKMSILYIKNDLVFGNQKHIFCLKVFVQVCCLLSVFTV